MSTLNEKEIQEKLYGKYLKGTMPVSEKQESISLRPTVEKPAEPNVVHVDLNRVWENAVKVFPTILQETTKFLQQVPWRFVGVLAGAVITAIVFIQLISFTLDKISGIFSHAKSKKQTVSESTESAGSKVLSSFSRADLHKKSDALEKKVKNELETKAVTSEVVSSHEASLPESDSVNSGLPVTSQTAVSDGSVARKQKFYAVQICTYQKEADAQKLSGVLKGLNFSPFFRKVDMPQQGTFYYEVYLGRSEDYVSAKAQLEDFKQTELFQKFSDSFIRSL
ncbi:MAG: hypothetical protein A3G33_10625 [Omnitrophica bacterium RIFCSPLOWO2_12_FULL_44_17]|uniref:SPOR domain-containing protein n=1 Tax=Candidatus Danuiimicrobium aquiferis TaxID=1801832 RepID=A0A1G1KR87_9BACT|nr:MAG: hypothetical protein A3B72_02945 [Omnitrophica bacterium RIFCSPHIGHO2_02_FULL_45_28]OGW89505.1 MAG: hypothetical protein A3E74_06965 [Omnitrophica bacterium RIFCSPHIGHO2_12_FULL_44_12]OGW95423.1 MAG: hypothetical protein A3G33_10625 [Omnitrophica bacterium RIFCSPLOWO2_12_FULL_44_17]OGX03305.1 MAG: hypothetical protein A3J12_07260 [Omnitrophica bacterium RIFCSPLOWO2_02_FULL_44_11]